MKLYVGYGVCALLYMWMAATVVAEEAEDMSSPETHRFLFVDQIAEEESLAALRSEWQRIVDEKNVEALLDLFAGDAHLSFGQQGPMDRETKRKFLGLIEMPENSPVWDEFDKLFALGGVVDKAKQRITIPWMHAYELPEHDWTRRIAKEENRDLTFELFVTLQATPLYESVDKEGAILRMLKPYETVLMVFDKEDGCESYRTHDGLKGCVNPAHVRALIDYRARFEKQGDDWKITYFVAGD